MDDESIEARLMRRTIFVLCRTADAQDWETVLRVAIAQAVEEMREEAAESRAEPGAENA